MLGGLSEFRIDGDKMCLPKKGDDTAVLYCGGGPKHSLGDFLISFQCHQESYESQESCYDCSVSASEKPRVSISD